MYFPFLPLSWTCANNLEEEIRNINLPLSPSKWLYYANFKELPSKQTFLKQLPKSIFLRGLNSFHKKKLSLDHEFLFIGKEALLDLEVNHFSKKSLIDLVRRGKRHGTTSELQHTNESITLLELFKDECSHSHEPQLKYLFSDYFSKNERLFIFGEGGTVWGAIVTSLNSPQKVHTELLLRRKNAPVGIMEALIYDIFTTLKTEGESKYLSLGEVPFVDGNSHINLKNKLILKAGKSLRIVYNYEGLYKFKNKFQPEWRDVFIAETGKVRFRTLFGVALQSNLLALTLFKLKRLFFSPFT